MEYMKKGIGCQENVEKSPHISAASDFFNEILSRHLTADACVGWRDAQ
jgi:hypothetical protein